MNAFDQHPSNPIVVERRFIGEKPHLRHCYWCPGCEALHCLPIYNQGQEKTISPSWEFTGTLEKPTYSPSQLSSSSWRGVPSVCHTFIREGMIEFLSDSTHHLSGKTVPLPPVPNWLVRERDEENDTDG